MLVLEKNQVAGLASAKIRRINIRKGYKDYRKKLPIKAAIVVSRRCFISLQFSILPPSCHRVCGGGRRFHLRHKQGEYRHPHPSHSHQHRWQLAVPRLPCDPNQPLYAKESVRVHWFLRRYVRLAQILLRLLDQLDAVEAFLVEATGIDVKLPVRAQGYLFTHQPVIVAGVILHLVLPADLASNNKHAL